MNVPCIIGHHERHQNSADHVPTEVGLRMRGPASGGQRHRMWNTLPRLTTVSSHRALEKKK